MKRRDFLAGSIAVGAAGWLWQPDLLAAYQTNLAGTPRSGAIPALTKYVAEFVVRTQYADIPPEVIELGKKSMLDGLGLAICGAAGETWPLIKSYLNSLGCNPGEARVLGTGQKVPARFAAFSNGVAIHLNDYDDTQLAAEKDRVYGLLTHPTVCVLPAALSLADVQKISGRDLILAYQLGVEVECKVAEAINPRHYEDGFHTTGTCGVFGSAAACAKLRAFDAARTVTTFGIAGSQAAGVRENFGTMMKPFHAGHSAEVGVFSTDLAELGWTATDRILEGPVGFFKASGGGYESDAILNKLGKPWTFISPGISIKPFPSGSLTHPGMTELLRLIHENHIKAEEVDNVEVGTNQQMPKTLIHHHPTTGLQAKFSMEFCVAILLLEGKAGLNEFTDAVVNRPDVKAMINRIHFAADPEAEKAGYDKMTTIIKIHLKDGRTMAGRADFAKGSPADPMSYEEVAEKFRDCAAFAKWPREKTDAIVESVHTLERLEDASTLTALCSHS